MFARWPSLLRKLLSLDFVVCILKISYYTMQAFSKFRVANCFDEDSLAVNIRHNKKYSQFKFFYSRRQIAINIPLHFEHTHPIVLATFCSSSGSALCLCL